jgi:hypothetical protein
MKTINYFNVKQFTKQAMILGLAGGLLVSCGKDSKKNEIDSTTTNPNPVGNSNPVFRNPSGNVNTQDLSLWNSLKSQYACNTQTGGRMQDLNFRLQGQAYGNMIGGQLSPISSPSGGAVASFMGANQGTRDLIYITQTSNGSSVQYNVVLSFCTWTQNIYGQQIQFIGPNSGMSNFRLDYADISNSTNCPVGKVTSGKVTFSSQTYGGNIYTQYNQVNTNCN